jgi:hypothetical protein
MKTLELHVDVEGMKMEVWVLRSVLQIPNFMGKQYFLAAGNKGKKKETPKRQGADNPLDLV